MKIRMIKKATVFLISMVMVILMAGVAAALDYYSVGYYEVGKSNFSSGNYALEAYYDGSTRMIDFPISSANRVSGTSVPTDTQLYNNWNYQVLGGTYSLSESGTSGIYNLTLESGVGTNTVKISRDTIYPNSYFSALATALQINFNDHTIKWSDLSNVAFNNTIGSSTLTNLQNDATLFQFSSFSFQALSNESNWLAGIDKDTKSVKYYAKMEGFHAAPEPAEWVLMFIGLGMLGFYLQRRGYLEFDLSRQSVA